MSIRLTSEIGLWVWNTKAEINGSSENSRDDSYVWRNCKISRTGLPYVEVPSSH